ncbi:hypothetical protein RJ640_013747 [Escallonia rubra]|uniref:Disease resistance N-terminal domain-containing protein n=1 Tax=Escallonia rubra TaxID=112253 RepID=A0AA88UAU2_9ASTE|nr:hypothetical protein RJ640_013747 [Escallonia rubra]
MAAFLASVDAREVTDPLLKVWIKQVRDVDHDIDDALHEFIPFRLSHYQGNLRFYGSVHRMCSYIISLKARHQLASNIQSIKSRVKAIVEGYQRYSSPLSISEGPNTSIDNTRLSDSRRVPLWSKDPNPVGIEKPKQQLVKIFTGPKPRPRTGERRAWVYLGPPFLQNLGTPKGLNP